METVTSSDGTTIAFDRLGDGPPIVLVSGGSTDRQANAPLATALSPDFAILNYDRRGRGPSGDTPPYAVAREVEDLAAVIAAAGGSAFVYGTSSGAALALEAAISGVPIDSLALWEPPYVIGDARRPPADQVEQYETMLAEGRRGDAVEYFMQQVVGLPAEFVAQARNAPFWAGQEALAHTLPYDARIMGDYSVPVERAAKVVAPTLVLVGGASFPFIRESGKTLSTALPNGRLETLPDQTHDVSADVMASALRDFFRA